MRHSLGLQDMAEWLGQLEPVYGQGRSMLCGQGSLHHHWCTSWDQRQPSIMGILGKSELTTPRAFRVARER